METRYFELATGFEMMRGDQLHHNRYASWSYPNPEKRLMLLKRA
jgi:hypothetical protein